MNSDEGQILDAFIDTIWIEKGLSQNTLNSYKSDTEKYLLWLSNNSLSYKKVSRADINYIHEPFLNHKEKMILNDCIEKNEVSAVGNYKNKFEKLSIIPIQSKIVNPSPIGIIFFVILLSRLT